MVENIRSATAQHVHPAAVGFDCSEAERREIAGHLGIMPEHSDVAFVSFSREDAKRRFISENPSFWADLEADLDLQLATQNNDLLITTRLRGALIDLMLSGRSGAEDVADALGISRSTLQRRLRDEGTTYQAELDAMRLEIGIRYLTKTNMNVEEIASVLAYRDANSFSRSFRRWTGTTPLGFRQEALNKAQARGANK